MSDAPPVLLGGQPEGDHSHSESTIKRTVFAFDEYAHPELIFVDSDPRHLWIGDKHLVETTDRRLTPGKHVLTVVGGRMLYEVTEVRDSSQFDSASVPDHIDDVENPADEVVLERKYDFESDSPASGTQSFPRYQYETEDALSMGDAPPLIFQPRNN